MKNVKLILLSLFIGVILALPVISSAKNTGYCFDCWSSYTYGPPQYRTTCTLVDHDIPSQSCYYSCAPGEGMEGYIVTFCDF